MILTALVFVAGTIEEILETLGTQAIVKGKAGRVAAINFLYSVIILAVVFTLIERIDRWGLILSYALGTAFGGWVTIKLSLEPFIGKGKRVRLKKPDPTTPEEKQVGT